MAKDETLYVANDSGVCAIPGDPVLCPVYFEPVDPNVTVAPDGTRHSTQ
jgi:hypothetical protein